MSLQAFEDLIDEDPCAVCGTTEISNDWAAHWKSASSSILAAWSCSPDCSAKLEARRIDGVLVMPNKEN